MESHLISFDDLSSRNMKAVICCVLDLARIGLRNGITPPPSVAAEQISAKKGSLAKIHLSQGIVI
jgi:hypothetical protein